MEIQAPYSTTLDLRAKLELLMQERADAEQEVKAQLTLYDQQLAALQAARSAFMLDSNHRLGVLDGKIEAIADILNLPTNE